MWIQANNSIILSFLLQKISKCWWYPVYYLYLKTLNIQPLKPNCLSIYFPPLFGSESLSYSLQIWIYYVGKYFSCLNFSSKYLHCRHKSPVSLEQLEIMRHAPVWWHWFPQSLTFNGLLYQCHGCFPLSYRNSKVQVLCLGLLSFKSSFLYSLLTRAVHLRI